MGCYTNQNQAVWCPILELSARRDQLHHSKIITFIVVDLPFEREWVKIKKATHKLTQQSTHPGTSVEWYALGAWTITIAIAIVKVELHCNCNRDENGWSYWRIVLMSSWDGLQAMIVLLCHVLLSRTGWRKVEFIIIIIIMGLLGAGVLCCCLLLRCSGCSIIMAGHCNPGWTIHGQIPYVETSVQSVQLDQKMTHVQSELKNIWGNKNERATDSSGYCTHRWIFFWREVTGNRTTSTNKRGRREDQYKVIHNMSNAYCLM